MIARARGGLRVAGVDVVPRAGGASTVARLRSRRRVGRLQPRRASVLAGARHAALRRLRARAFCPMRRRCRSCRRAPCGVVLHSLPQSPRRDSAARQALSHAGVTPRMGSAASAQTSSSLARSPSASTLPSPPVTSITWASSRCGRFPHVGRAQNAFVDLQDDVTVRDIALAAREGYQAIEHLKRYTTLGMGTDQGKTSNVIGLALMGEYLGVPIPQVGTTTFRPPYTPITLGVLPGHAHGPHVEPTRYTAMHAWHAEHGARFVNAGLWKRPHSYPRDRRVGGRRGEPRGAQRSRERRRRRRVDARQDRAAGTRRRRISQSDLHQPLGHRCRSAAAATA